MYCVDHFKIEIIVIDSWCETCVEESHNLQLKTKEKPSERLFIKYP
jgi:hypothetical protein